MRSFVFALSLFAGAPQAASVVVTHRFMDGVLTLKAEDKTVNVVAMKRYLVVHPVAYDHRYRLSPGVRLCIEAQAGYKPCGTRDIHAKYFFANAAHNLQIANEHLSYLDQLKDFPELQPLVEYFRSSLRFDIWKDQRLLAYYRTWDPAELEQDYGALPVKNETTNILAALKKTSDVDARWKLSHYRWSTAANHLYRDREGTVPSEVWTRFLRERQIVESIEYDKVD